LRNFGATPDVASHYGADVGPARLLTSLLQPVIRLYAVPHSAFTGEEEEEEGAASEEEVEP
jgi:hypothetical protein